MEKCLSSTPLNEKIFINVHKIEGAHPQCMNNHYAKFKYKGIKTLCYRLHNLGTQKDCGQTDRQTEGVDPLLGNIFRQALNARKETQVIFCDISKVSIVSSMLACYVDVELLVSLVDFLNGSNLHKQLCQRNRFLCTFIC